MVSLTVFRAHAVPIDPPNHFSDNTSHGRCEKARETEREQFIKKKIIIITKIGASVKHYLKHGSDSLEKCVPNNYVNAPSSYIDIKIIVFYTTLDLSH